MIDHRHALYDMVRAGEVAHAVELARAWPDLVPTLEASIYDYVDPYLSAGVLGAVVEGDALHRELVRFSLWCARSVEHLWQDRDRPALARCLEAAECWLAGTAAAEDCRHVAAYAYATTYAASPAGAAAAAAAAAAAGHCVADAAAAAADASHSAVAATSDGGRALRAQRLYLARRVTLILEVGDGIQ
jgi:hypothetical protein